MSTGNTLPSFGSAMADEETKKIYELLRDFYNKHPLDIRKLQAAIYYIADSNKDYSAAIMADMKKAYED